MPELSTIYDYMRRHAALLGDRILQEYPALHQFDDAVSPRIEGLLRTPFPAQTIAIMGVPLVDNGYFEDVAKEAANRKRWEFLTTVQFTRIPGGTATSSCAPMSAYGLVK